MKVKIYYQDFYKNATFLGPKHLIFKPETATYICTLAVDETDQGKAADHIFNLMNIQPPQEQDTKSNYETAGHTSMSVGDYVMFEDGNVLLCAAIGWVSQRIEKLVL